MRVPKLHIPHGREHSIQWLARKLNVDRRSLAGRLLGGGASEVEAKEKFTVAEAFETWTARSEMTFLLLAFSRSARRQLASAILIVTFAGQTFATESLEQTVNYLIDHVGKSDATFIRNGVSHTPAEAVAHIKAKYEHFKNQIKTPEDFIRLAASRSLMTGNPYLVRTPDAKEMRLDAWLTDALKEYRARKHE